MAELLECIKGNTLAQSIVTLSLIYGCILIHELGHYAAYRCFGIKARFSFKLAFAYVEEVDDGEWINAAPFKRALCSLAGPLATFLCLIVWGYVVWNNNMCQEVFDFFPEHFSLAHILEIWPHIVLLSIIYLLVSSLAVWRNYTDAHQAYLYFKNKPAIAKSEIFKSKKSLVSIPKGSIYDLIACITIYGFFFFAACC